MVADRNQFGLPSSAVDVDALHMRQNLRASGAAHEHYSNACFSLTARRCRMMALNNNWDLKQENDAVYEEKHGDS